MIGGDPLLGGLVPVNGIRDMIGGSVKDDGWHHPGEGPHDMEGFLSLLDGIGSGRDRRDLLNLAGQGFRLAQRRHGISCWRPLTEERQGVAVLTPECTPTAADRSG